jgi:hypothetical protein
MPCPNPACKEGWIRLKSPVVSLDHCGRPIVTDRVPCMECIGSIASCCDGAGAAQPEPQGAGDV